MSRLFALAALLTALAAPLAAAAQDARPALGVDGEQTDMPRRGGHAPLARVLAALAQRFPGRHLNTTMGESGGRPVYFVQWQMANGRVVVFVVDADTGQVIGRQGS